MPSPRTSQVKQKKTPLSRFTEAEAWVSSWKGQRICWLPPLSPRYSTPYLSSTPSIGEITARGS